MYVTRYLTGKKSFQALDKRLNSYCYRSNLMWYVIETYLWHSLLRLVLKPRSLLVHLNSSQLTFLCPLKDANKVNLLNGYHASLTIWIHYICIFLNIFLRVTETSNHLQGREQWDFKNGLLMQNARRHDRWNKVKKMSVLLVCLIPLL